MDQLDREIERDEFVRMTMERLEKELSWYRKQLLEHDIKKELADLIDEHFEGLRALAYSFAELSTAMQKAEIPYSAVEENMNKVLNQIMALGPHAQKFKELYAKMPDRNDVFLATIDTPPRMM